MKLINLKGNKYGTLTVLDYIGNQKYKCVCECGKTTEVFASNLTSGHTKSCGCRKNKESVMQVGKTYKDALILDKTKVNSRNVFKCICECGNVFEISESYARNAKSLVCRSCSKKIWREGFINSEWYKSDYVNGTQLSQLGHMTSANKSGVVGVNWDKSRNKWQASIRYQGKKYNLGRFDDIQDAIDSRKNAEIEMFGHELSEKENNG